MSITDHLPKRGEPGFPVMWQHFLEQALGAPRGQLPLPKYGEQGFDTILCHSLQGVRDHPNRALPWPSEDSFDLAQGIVRQTAFEVAVVKDGRMLAEFRTFAEWAKYNTPEKKWDIPGWYIPGGFLLRDLDAQGNATDHILKDLRGEYMRAGVQFDFSSLWLGPPQFLGVKLWEPGTHPVGQPVSILIVCEDVEEKIVETDCLKWTDETIPTQVPYHQAFQDVVFRYRKASATERVLMHELNTMMLGAQAQLA